MLLLVPTRATRDLGDEAVPPAERPFLVELHGDAAAHAHAKRVKAGQLVVVDGVLAVDEDEQLFVQAGQLELAQEEVDALLAWNPDGNAAMRAAIELFSSGAPIPLAALSARLLCPGAPGCRSLLAAPELDDFVDAHLRAAPSGTLPRLTPVRDALLRDVSPLRGASGEGAGGSGIGARAAQQERDAGPDGKSLTFNQLKLVLIARARGLSLGGMRGAGEVGRGGGEGGAGGVAG